MMLKRAIVDKTHKNSFFSQCRCNLFLSAMRLTYEIGDEDLWNFTE